MENRLWRTAQELALSEPGQETKSELKLKQGEVTD